MDVYHNGGLLSNNRKIRRIAENYELTEENTLGIIEKTENRVRTDNFTCYESRILQDAERYFIIGNLRGERRPEILPFGENDGESFEESSEVCQCIRKQYHKGSNGTHIKQLNNPTHSNNRIYGEEGISPALNTAQGGNRQPKIRAVLTPDRPEKRQNGRRFKEDGEPSFTITGQDIHGITDGIKIRRLTPRECCRLQGFPDDWNDNMSDTQRYKPIGNAVTTNVIAAIGSQILNNKNTSKDKVFCNGEQDES